MTAELLAVHLLGTPTAERGGTPLPPPKGRKAWALLAYLILSERPASRSELARLLFGDADDPLGALRWNLAQLRRLLGDPQGLRGKEVEFAAPGQAFIDVRVVTRGTWLEATRLPGLGRDLLEGMSFSSDPAFETWLMIERTRLNATAATVLREAAAACLGTGRPELTVDYASKLIAGDPFDEVGHELLIRGLVAAGRRDRAEEALRSCLELFRKELGAEPGSSVTSALELSRMTPPAASPGGPAAARAQIDLGEAAIKAGAVDNGIECLRSAVATAEAAGEGMLTAEALLALGSALVHSVRGRDGEASTVLHQALDIASRLDLTLLNAACHRELGYIEVLIAQYERALGWLEKALVLSGDDPGERAWALAYQAICYSDTGRYEEAIDGLNRCLGAGDASEIPNQAAFAMCLLGRVHMLRGELDAARESLERSLAIAEQHAWTSFVPWPEALLSDVDMLQGDDGARAKSRLEHAFSIAQRIGDPCWQGAAMRGLGLVEADGGEVDLAVDRLQEATRLCVKFPDGYRWMQAYALDALCAVSSEAGLQSADRWVSDLEALAGRTGMKEMLARVYLHKARRGEVGAADTAGFFAQQVDNPALAAEVSRASDLSSTRKRVDKR